MAQYLTHYFIAILILQGIISNQASITNNPLNSKFSFKLRCVITDSSGADRNPDTFELQESYSWEQKRAKIEFNQVSGLSHKSTFYFDQNQDVSLVIDTKIGGFKCRSSSIGDFYNKIKLNLIDLEAQNDQATDEFVLGPARLLFLVDKNRHRMNPVSFDEPLSVRNISCQVYKFEIANRKGDKMEINVYYSDQMLPSAVDSTPIRISIPKYPIGYLGYEDKQITYDYMDIVTLPSFSSAEQINNAIQIEHDPFIFPPFKGCPQALAGKEVNLFEGRSAETSRFSFKTTFQVPGGRWSAYIAYDGALKSLRYDRIDAEQRSGMAQQIFNFKLNRMYHVLQRGRGSTLIDVILDMSRQKPREATDAVSEVDQCIVSRILPQRMYNESSFSLAQILVGTDKFIYLGRAKVRGIEALVYEIHTQSLPYWLDQPVPYKTKNGEQKVYYPDSAVPDGIHVSSLLLYVGQKQQGYPLLHMQLNKFHQERDFVSSKSTISFFNFAWDLSSLQPDGESGYGLFSLHDQCSAGSSEESAQVKLLLESELPKLEVEQHADWLQVSHARNAALVGSLQSSIRLAATMIHDVESKLLHSHQTKEGRQIVAASFQISDHADKLAELIYIGQGSVYKTSRSMTVSSVRSFQACFFLAAHLRSSVYIGYNPKAYECYLDTEPIESLKTNSAGEEVPPNFVMTREKWLNVYRVIHLRVNDGFDIKSGSWVREVSNTAGMTAILGRKLKLQNDTEVVFTVKRAQIDAKLSSLVNTIGGDQPVDSNQLHGFGLLETESGNKRIGPSPLGSHIWKPLSEQLVDSSSNMDYDQCRVACMVDFQCQSFSTCTRNGQIECVLSPVSFRSPNVTKQLMSKEFERDKSKVKVALDERTTVELRYYPNCDLYNMRFLDFFRAPTICRSSFANRRIYKIESAESCAKLAVNQTIEALRLDVNRKAMDSMASLRSSNTLNADTVQNLLAAHKQATDRILRSFFYIEDVQLEFAMKSEIADAIRNQAGSSSDQSTNGYCILGERTNSSATPDISFEIIKLSLYSFNFGIFYEKKYGVKLKVSPFKDSREMEFYSSVATAMNRSVGSEAFETMRQLVDRGNNFQTSLEADEALCAQLCFRQVLGPWPACRSFDLMFDEENKQLVCQMNSITLRQAIENQRLDLIVDETRKMQVWHYEPRAGLAFDESIANGNLELIEEDFSQYYFQLSFRIHTLGSICIIFIAIVGGLYLGILISTKYIDRKDEDKSKLIKRASSVQFTNLVNSEGSIKEVSVN